MARSVGPLLLALLVCSTAAAQAMYSWTDKRGVVHYTDDPGAIPKEQKPKAKKTSGARIETVKNDAPRARTGGTSGYTWPRIAEPAPAAAAHPETQSPPRSAASSAEEARLAASIRNGESAKARAQPSVNPGSCHNGNCRADGYTWTPDMEERLRSERAHLEKLRTGQR